MSKGTYANLEKINLKENIDLEGKRDKTNGLKISIGRWIEGSEMRFNKCTSCSREWEGME